MRQNWPLMRPPAGHPPGRGARIWWQASRTMSPGCSA